MRTEDFDYELPPQLIAQAPARPRDSSRLLVLDRGKTDLAHARFRDIGRYLHPGDLLVLNQTRVIPARLYARKQPGGGRAELLLLRKEGPRTWEVLVGGRGIGEGRRLSILAGAGGTPGQGFRRFGDSPSPDGEVGGSGDGEGEGSKKPSRPPQEAPPPLSTATTPGIEAEVLRALDGPRRLVRFSLEIEPYLNAIGHVPFPPYIQRPLADPGDYQTVFSRVPGSAAAPTAGLHFTPELLEELRLQGVGLAYLTLHIGLDTFAPVTKEEAKDHAIHTEWCQLDPSAARAINQARGAGGRVVAVGTTSVRTLETAAHLSPSGQAVSAWEGQTDLFILPGHHFRAVDALVTNFHLPRSTLVMLVSAFAGRERILAAYEAAIREEYRFYSFGDAMLIL